MSSLRGVASVGKRCAQRRHHLRRVVDRERRLRHDGELRRVAHGELLGIGHRLDQVDAPAEARVEAAHRALHLRVAGVADQDHVEAVARVAADFHVHLGDERAGRVEHGEPAPLGLLLHAARHAVRAEDDGRAVRHGVELVHEHGAEAAQAVHDELVVHHLVAHVDRRAEQLDRALHDVDRAVDAGAEAPRVREQDFHQAAAFLRRPSSSASMISMMAPVVMRDVRDVEGREVGVVPVEVQVVDDVAVDEAVVGIADGAAEDQREPDREPVLAARRQRTQPERRSRRRSRRQARGRTSAASRRPRRAARRPRPRCAGA